MSKWLSILTLFACVGVVGWQGVGELGLLSGRLRSLESRALRDSREAQTLEAELLRVNAELAAVQGALEAKSRELAALRDVALRVGQAEDRLTALVGTIDAQRTSLAELEGERLGSATDVLEAHFASLDQDLRSRWESAYELARSAAETASESQLGLEQLTESLSRRTDHAGMWRGLVAPVVQLNGEDSVGSGVLLESTPDGAGWRTFVLTAWHVVRDIQGSLEHVDMPVPVMIEHEDGSSEDVTATLLEFNPEIDVALLALDKTEPVPYGAVLPPRSRLTSLQVFDPIYAVGCPLGNAPIPTPGEIAARHHVVDGAVYVLINAPTYVGNSGGGIFHAETRELLGIFSKVYTHGAVRPTIVPHMGLITPMDVVYDWLDAVGYGHLEPGGK